MSKPSRRPPTRAACLFLTALLVSLALLPLSARAQAADEESTGYWERVDITVTPAEYVTTDESYRIASQELRHEETHDQYVPGEPDNLLVRVVCVATCNTTPPETIRPGDSFELTTTIEFADVWYQSWGLASPRTFHTSVGSDGLDVDPKGLSGLPFLDADWDPKRRVTQTWTLTADPRKAGRDFTVSFSEGVSYVHGTTVWSYRWTSDDVSYRVEDQVVSTPASETPGEQVTDILSTIIEGFDPSEGGLYTVIGGIAAGTVVVIGSATYLRYRRRRKGKADTAPEKQAQPKKTYRMVLRKDFGNRLRPGARPREVYARIEESSDGVNFSPNSKLTAAIEAEGIQGLEVLRTDMGARELCVRIAVPKSARRGQGGAAPDQPTLVLSYRGQAGAFINRVGFQLMEDPVIDLTNVRGERLATTDGDVDALLGDRRGSVFYFCVRNFIGKPTEVVVPKEASAQGVTVHTLWQPHELTEEVLSYFEGDRQAPYFRVRVACPATPTTRYGAWPLTVELPLRVTGDPAELDFAEATVTLLLWPEGIFFDTSIAYELPSARPLPHDHVLVDSALERSRDYDDHRLRISYVGVGAAYRCPGDIVEVQALNHDPWMEKYRGEVNGSYPEIGTRWTRLTGTDEASRHALDDSDPRVWYDLRLSQGIYVGGMVDGYDVVGGTRPAQPGYDDRPWLTGPESEERIAVAQRMSSKRRGIYSRPARVSFVEVEPLLPLLVDDPGTEYLGTLHVSHQRTRVDREHGTPLGLSSPGNVYEADLSVGFVGISAGAYELERLQLIRDINRLLGVFRIHDLERTQEIFAKYGLASERVLRKLGTREELQALGMTTDALLKEVNYIQSVQRLRFIRQAIFEAGVEYVQGEGEHVSWLLGKLGLPDTFTGLSYAQLATFYDLNLTFWKTARWGVDLAFTCWWYRLMGKNGAYVEAIATPIKDWMLEWCSELGLWLTDDYQVDPDKFFTAKRLRELVFTIIENEILNVFVSSLVRADGSFVAGAIRKGANCLGGAWLFFLFVHIHKNIKRNPETGLNELDLWEALKGATKDCTILGLKAVISIAIAWVFGRAVSRNMRAQTDAQKKVTESVNSFRDSSLKENVAWWRGKAQEWFGAAGETSQDLVHGVQTRLGAPLHTERSLVWEVVQDGKSVPIYNPLDTTKRNEIWQGFFDSALQKAATDDELSVAQGVQEQGWLEPFDSWYRGLGTCDVTLPDRDGKPILQVRMPFADLITLMVDWLFDHWDFFADLEKIRSANDGKPNPDYVTHPELVDRMAGIPGAEREVDFLTGKGGRKRSNNTDTRSHFSQPRFY